MNQSSKELSVKPKRKLWRTRLKMARKTFQFAPRISVAEVQQPDILDDELQHWGEYTLLSDSLCVLHRDGTITRRTHNLTKLYANESLAQWDEVYRFYDRQTSLHKIQTAKVYLPDGSIKKARKVVQPYGQTSVNFYPLRPGVTIELEEQQDFFVPDRIAPCTWGAGIFSLCNSLPTTSFYRCNRGTIFTRIQIVSDRRRTSKMETGNLSGLSMGHASRSRI